MKRIVRRGKGVVGMLFAAIAFLATGSNWAAETGSASKFELRRVVPDGQAGKSKTLPWFKAPVHNESELRVEEEALLREEHIQKAEVQKNPLSGNDEVRVTLTPAGKELFSEVTKANIGKKLAVVIDGKVALAPVIQQQISGGTLVISGNLTADEAKEIARLLTSTK